MLIRSGRGWFAAFVLVVSLLVPRLALALPSYAQQTGAPCAQCHTIAFGPALTPFGQQFKLNAYSWGSWDNWQPAAAMMVASFNHTNEGQPGGPAPHFGDNNNSAIDQTSAFYAGRITEHSGAFAQFTYDGVERHLAWDNLDVRYAKASSIGSFNLVSGISINNNPTVQDLWNSTPAWSFPYESSVLAPSPTAATLIEGALAAQVLGITGYSMVNNMVFVEAGVYKTLPRGVLRSFGALRAPDSLTAIDAPAPYWRLVLQQQFGSNYVSAGLFGLNAKLDPGGDYGRDRYTDFGYDTTWQFSNGGAWSYNANLTYIHELQNLAASEASGAVGVQHNQLNTLRFNAGAVFQQTYSLSGGPFNIRGGADPTFYSPDAIDGSASGSPNSRGFIGQLEYVPFGKSDSWARPLANVRIGLQYTYYTEFNGGDDNYDGSGRNARDNNTTYVFVWFAI